MNDFSNWVWDNIAWTLLQAAFVSLAVCVPGYGFLKFALDKLQNRKEQVAFWITSPFLLIFAITGLKAIASPSPNLIIEDNTLGWGGNVVGIGLQNPINMMLTITNAGNMATAVKDYHLSTVYRGTTYQGQIEVVPHTLTLGSREKSPNITYTDAALYEKTLAPIPSGGLVRGILLFSFPDIDQDAFRDEAPVSFTLRVADVRGTIYRLNIPVNRTDEKQLYYPGVSQTMGSPDTNPPAEAK